MLFPIGQLLEGRAAPLCVPRTATVREALSIMVKNDFSQLPVVDEAGHLVGIVSDQSITRTYYLLGDVVSLLDLTIEHCVARVDPLSPDDDLFEACDQLHDAAGALVVVEDGKPVGLLTAYDMTNFFRHRSEDFIHIEDIEVTLRLRTRDAFPDDAALNRALIVALGADPTDPTKPRKEFNTLNMGDMIYLITNEQNWPYFNGIFEPLELFRLLMNRVREVRNLLAHFRGRADQVQDTTLKYAIDWLAMRSRLQAADDNPLKRRRIHPAEIPPRQPGSNRYDVLREWLRRQDPAPAGLRVAFGDLETLLGGKLPGSAVRHASWWSNTNLNEAQCRAWHDAGWQVGQVDLTMHEVVFQPLAGAGSPTPTPAVPIPPANGANPPVPTPAAS
jgi:CBS domain-containing protein